MTVELNGKHITSQETFHKEIKRVLDFPDYYGENLDALWDCLTSWIDLPLTLIWSDYEMSKLQMGEYAGQVLKVFRAAETELDGFRIKIR